MRVVSLLPSATELLCAIGGRDLLVGISHECDFPLGLDLPVLTAARIAHAPPAEIDAQVRQALSAGQPLYTLDAQRLADLRPDLIVTQDVCSVCSIDLATVRRVADDLARLGQRPRVLSLNPATVEDVIDDMIRLGEATGLERPSTAAALAMNQRMLDAQSHVNPYDDGPVVGFLEWTDPLFVAGHWSVQIIERAGGRHPLNPTRAPDDAGAAAGLQQGARRAGKSVTVSPVAFAATNPDWLVIAPCGLTLDQAWEATRELARHDWFGSLPAVRHGRVAVVDGNQMFNRPGPRLVDAFEWLVSWLQGVPGLCPTGFPWRAWRP